MEFYTNVLKRGNDILYRGYKDGESVMLKDRFSPTLYFYDSNGTHRSLHGDLVSPKTFETMKHAQDHIKQFTNVSGMNTSVYGNNNYVVNYVQEKFPDKIKFDLSKINITYFDIETGKDPEGRWSTAKDADGPITSIALKSNKSKTMYVWGLKPYVNNDKNKEIYYYQCSTEQDLLKSFVNHWKFPGHTPDVITGWNSEGYDIPYLINRIIKVCGTQTANELSPWKILKESNSFIQGRQRQSWNILGVSSLDYMEIFRKFGFQGEQDSYKLGHIAHSILGDSKLSYDEYKDLADLYEKDFQKFIDYNIKDIELIERLEDKLGLIQLTMTMAYRGGVNFSDTLGTVGIWDAIIYRFLMSKNIIAPPKRSKTKHTYPGGYVKEPMIGKHKWVVSFDLNSLYPNIIVQWNMSPETITTERISVDNTIASNNTQYIKSKQGMIPEIIIDYYAERKIIKNKMLKVEQEYQNNKSYDLEKQIAQLNSQQMGIKILMNSLYGAMANEYFRYFEMDIAEAITITGQKVIKWSEKSMNNFMNKVVGTEDVDYIIALDTDSVYVNFEPLVNKFIKSDDPKQVVPLIDKMCNDQFLPMLEKAYIELFDETNSYIPRMEMGREVIADTGIWTAKKRYILNVYNSEGVQYDKPKLKIMGIEAIKSSTPEICRNALKSIFKTIIDKDEFETQKEIKEFKDKFYNSPAEDVSFPRGVTEINKWMLESNESHANKGAINTRRLGSECKKGTPINSRASIIYNNLLNINNLQNTYEEIKAGDKIKYCYLNEPNTAHSRVIGFKDYLPKEFGLDKYIDYKTQFDKTFLDAISPILKAIGYEAEKSASLTNFF